MDNEIIRDAQTVLDSERIEKMEALYKEQSKTNKIKRGAFLTAFSVILGLILSKTFGLLLALINQYYTEIGNKEVTDFILSEEGSLLKNQRGREFLLKRRNKRRLLIESLLPKE